MTEKLKFSERFFFFFYSIFILILSFGMKFGAFFNKKLKKGIEGRRQSIKKIRDQLTPSDAVVWMHAASYGEYLQGLPVLEKMKTKYPECKILVTFFSPSGYEAVSQKQNIADVVCYLPFDTPKKIQTFISSFNTKVFFTVKYDYWYVLLHQLHQKNVPCFIISALFYPKQIYFKCFGRLFVNQLKKTIAWFFHQTKTSEHLAQSIGLIQSSVSGDTRFDRVKQNLSQDHFVSFIKDFKNSKKMIVFGSSWLAETEIAKKISQKAEDCKIILAPHELKNAKDLKKVFPNCLYYSELKNTTPTELENTNVLIIDSIGLLSQIYAYADIAIVGGGFHKKGLHNILEAACFSIPIIIGDRYRKNPEADDLLLMGGLASFSTVEPATEFILNLLKNEKKRLEMGKKSGEFIKQQPNSSELICTKIDEILK